MMDFMTSLICSKDGRHYNVCAFTHLHMKKMQNSLLTDVAMLLDSCLPMELTLPSLIRFDTVIMAQYYLVETLPTIYIPSAEKDSTDCCK